MDDHYLPATVEDSPLLLLLEISTDLCYFLDTSINQQEKDTFCAFQILQLITNLRSENLKYGATSSEVSAFKQSQISTFCSDYNSLFTTKSNFYKAIEVLGTTEANFITTCNTQLSGMNNEYLW